MPRDAVARLVWELLPSAPADTGTLSAPCCSFGVHPEETPQGWCCWRQRRAGCGTAAGRLPAMSLFAPGPNRAVHRCQDRKAAEKWTFIVCVENKWMAWTLKLLWNWSPGTYQLPASQWPWALCIYEVTKQNKKPKKQKQNSFGNKMAGKLPEQISCRIYYSALPLLTDG